jgi:hypothetical protein
MAVRTQIHLEGRFFRGNPIGRLRLNVYAVLRDEGQVAVEATREALRSKQRSTSPPLVLADNIVAVPTRRRGGTSRVVVSANYGPQPLVRFHNRFVDSGQRAGGKVRRGYRFYAAGARTVQGHIDSNITRIERRLTEGLT